MAYPKRSVRIRLLEKRHITTNGCWEFIGAKDRRGYGRMFDGKESERVHRIAYEIFIGRIGDKFVCHRCDNPPCFNPEHLFLGFSKDNQIDASSKGRSRGKWMPGVLSSNAKLTEADVLEIRSLYNPRIYTAKMLAKKFCLSVGCITKVIHNESWKHLKAAGK